jgi:hypothetical protein
LDVDIWMSQLDLQLRVNSHSVIFDVIGIDEVSGGRL